MFAPPKIIFSCYVPGSMLPGDFFCKYKSPRYRLMHLHWGDLWITGLLDYWITGLLDYWITGLLDYCNASFRTAAFFSMVVM